ncbi:MAG: S9 family peptidase [Fimbriimonadales bacterium]
MAPKQKAQKRNVKRKITVDDIKSFILVSDPQISPDGSKILFTRKHVGEKNEYVANLWVVDTQSGATRQFTNSGKDGHGRWSPDGTKIAFISGRNKPGSQIFSIPADGGEATQLTKFDEGGVFGFRWSPDGSAIACMYRAQDPEWTEEAKKGRENNGGSTPARVLDDVWYRLDGDGYFNMQRSHLYVVDARSGVARKIFDKDKLGFNSFDWSPDSKEIVIAANLDPKPLHRLWKTSLYRINVSTGKHKEVPNLPEGSKDNVQWSPDGKWLAYSGTEGREDLWSAKNEQLFVCSASQGKPTTLTKSQDYCVAAATLSDTRDAAFGSNYVWSKDSKSLLINIGWHGETHLASIPASGGPIKFLTSGKREVALCSISKDGKSLGIAVGSFHALNEIYVGSVKSTTVETKKLTKFNDDLLKELELADVEEHWLTTPDKTKLHTWVMKPTGKSSGKHPAVLEIHGGPHAQYGVPFFHEFQVLAANGYVVVFTNPRGSKGYGEDHCNAIAGDWGNKDWIDMQTAIEFMKSRSYIDSKRMGVMGGSYGGYMTNWIIGHTHDFAGAITDRCVSNMISMAGNSDFPFFPDKYWQGAPWDRPESLWQSSPIKHFKNVKTPTLIIHSEGDLRCNVEQGEQVFSALKVMGVPTRFVRYPASTSHGMSRSGPPDLRIHRLNQILNWWNKYLSKPRRKG